MKVPKKKPEPSSNSTREFPPALTPEERDNQLITLATDLVEQRLRNGTASSQETTFFLKLGSQRERLERQILEKQKDLMDAKTASLQSAQRMEELFEEAIKAFKTYSGGSDEDTQDIY